MFRHSSLGVAQNCPSKFCCYGNCPSELGSCVVKVLVHRSRVVKVIVHWSCADKVIVLRSCAVQASVWHTPVSDTHNDQTPLLFSMFLNVLTKCFLLFSSPLLSSSLTLSQVFLQIMPNGIPNTRQLHHDCKPCS